MSTITIDDMTNQAVVRVGVQVFVVQNGQVLLGKRQNGFQADTWALPGGCLELGESIFECAARELWEETGLIATQFRFVCIADATTSTNHFLQIGVEALEWKGVPENKEPEFCSAMRFYHMEELPRDIFGSSQPLIESYRNKTLYQPTAISGFAFAEESTPKTGES